MNTDKNQGQQHPQLKKDWVLLQKLQEEGAKDKNLAELARLRIRYHNFPGNKDTKELQNFLDDLLNKWGYTEESLFEKTRELHANNIFGGRGKAGNEDEWS